MLVGLFRVDDLLLSGDNSGGAAVTMFSFLDFLRGGEFILSGKFSFCLDSLERRLILDRFATSWNDMVESLS